MKLNKVSRIHIIYFFVTLRDLLHILRLQTTEQYTHTSCLCPAGVDQRSAVRLFGTEKNCVFVLFSCLQSEERNKFLKGHKE